MVIKITKNKNKKGWIRIVEASIAILIIFSVLISISQIRKKSYEKDLSESITPVLEEIAKNAIMREIIIKDTKESDDAENMINDFVEKRLKNPNIEHDVCIYDYSEICGLEDSPVGARENLYASSRIISSELYSDEKNSKRVTLFLWIKK